MENNKMFEPRTLWAVIIVFVGLISWNYFVSTKYPQQSQTVQPNTSSVQVNESSNKIQNTAATENNLAPNSNRSNPDLSNNNGEILTNDSTAESFVEIETNNYKLKVSSLGLGLKEVILKNFKDKNSTTIQLGHDQAGSLFSVVNPDSKSLYNFNLEKTSQFQVVGKYTDKSGLVIERVLDFDENSFGVKSQVKIFGQDKVSFLDFLITDKIQNSEGGHFLFPSYDLQDFFIKFADKTENTNYSMAKEDIKEDTKKLGHLISLGSQYFSTAFLNTSDTIPDFILNTTINDKLALAKVRYQISAGKSEHNLSQLFYFGPKKVELLENVNPELVSIMNYGFFGFIAHPLLKLMKFFQSYVGNWGLAIILLTLVVRAIVLPFNLMSFKSMKAMQKIQPKMQLLKEKYKDDPLALNRETMALMKENKANPLSGCLPMLLQIPIFFALYRVIASSIEIYQQPFVGWITDLTLHDKFFILPFLMGATMFVQQKITPTTTVDPIQAKVLLWMPVLFTGLMIFLPSGLTLYMFVSSLFGVIQQYFFMKMKEA